MIHFSQISSSPPSPKIWIPLLFSRRDSDVESRYTRHTPEWTLIGVVTLTVHPWIWEIHGVSPIFFLDPSYDPNLGSELGCRGITLEEWRQSISQRFRHCLGAFASQSISIWRCPPNIGVPPGYPSNDSFLLRDLPCQWHKPSSCWGTPHGTHVEDTHPAIGKQWVRDPAGCAKDSSWDLVHLLLPRCRQAPRRFDYLVLVVYICAISILRLACANLSLCGACKKPAREWFRSIFQNINSVVEWSTGSFERGSGGAEGQNNEMHSTTFLSSNLLREDHIDHVVCGI